MRDLLLDCCALDWSRISPAIFGALFQSVMDPQQRRHLGAHYTTEKNILKLIGPLFLDELRAEFERVKNQRKRLAEFHQRLARLNSSTRPAAAATSWSSPTANCAGWNWMSCAPCTRTARQLLDVQSSNIFCDVDQFYGIEMEEFPAQIAQTACG